MFKYSSDNTTFYVERNQGLIKFLIGEGDQREQVNRSELPEKLPLYRLDKLTANIDKTVYFCKSEEEADRLTYLDFLAITFCDERTDFSPLQKRRIVVTPQEDIEDKIEALKKITPNVKPFGNDTPLEEIPDENLLTFIEKHRPGIKTIEWEDLKNLDIPPRKYVIGPWLIQGSINIIYAPPGVGKTQLAMIVAYVAATAAKIFNWEAPERRYRVLYYDAEMNLVDIKERVEILNNSFEVDYHKGSLRFANLELQPDNAMPDIFTEAGRIEVEESLGAAEILVLDNLSAMFSGEENSSTDWAPIKRWLLKLRSRGLTVIIVHHTTKDPENPTYRGSSALADNPNELLKLTHPIGYVKSEGTRFNLDFMKCRSMQGVATETIQIFLVKDENGLPVWKHLTLEELRRLEWEDLFRKFQNMKDLAQTNSLRDVCIKMGITVSEYKALLKEARSLGVLRTVAGQDKWNL